MKPGVKGCGAASQAVSWPHSQFLPSRRGVDSPIWPQQASAVSERFNWRESVQVGG